MVPMEGPMATPPRPARPRTSLNVTAAEMAALRDLALALGLRTTRGPDAGRAGNVTALMAALAAAHRAAPARVAAALAALLAPRDA